MKIIRIRRGFITNSSGANEYIPPPPPPDLDYDAGPDGGSSGSHGPVHSRWATSTPDSGPATNMAPTDAGAPGVAAAPPDAGRTTPSGAGTTGNGLILFLVVLGVLVLFGAERLIRFARRKLRKESHEEPPAGPSE